LKSVIMNLIFKSNSPTFVRKTTFGTEISINLNNQNATIGG
jgi:hypothetical protein